MDRTLLVLMAIIVLACSGQKVASEQELNEYILVPENGLLKNWKKNGVDIEAIYRPTELILVQQLQGVTDRAERLRTINNFDSLSYFVLKLSRNGHEVENAYAGNSDRFTKLISYLSSEVAANIYLVHARDTIRALDAVYARMFGSADATSLMAVFNCKLKQLDGRIRFCFDDTGLGLGRNEFEFDLSDIKKAPTLNLN